jgi:hypothetical protein
MLVINKHSKENGSNTPDFILAEYLIECLRVFDKTTRLRNDWYGEKICEEKIRESRNKPEKEIDEFTSRGHISPIDIDVTFGGEKPGYPTRRNAELP